MIAVLNSVLSVYYYLGVLVAMYMTEGTGAIAPPSSRPYVPATILIAAGARDRYPSSRHDGPRAAFISFRERRGQGSGRGAQPIADR